MTEQTGSTPPDWYTNPPEWLRNPPSRRDRDPGDSYGDRDRDRRDYRDRDRDRDRGYDVRDLETAIRGMPEAVVSALKEAIQGATQQRQSTEQNSGQQEQNSGQQNSGQQNSTGSNGAQGGADDQPGKQLTFADKWFSNSL